MNARKEENILLQAIVEYGADARPEEETGEHFRLQHG